MGLIGSIGQVTYDIVALDGTGPGTEAAQRKLMTVGAAMTIVGAGAKVLVDSVNQSFLGFDESTTAVKALGAMTEEEFGKMKDAAVDISTQVPVSAIEVSDAFYKMVSVGYDFDTMMATIPEATKLAVGGNQELSESVDTVINVFGAYGTKAYTAADITNILAKSVGVGKWELGDFTTEMQKNVGVAAQLGISFEDTAAANVLLQSKFTSAEEAGTAFKTMLLRLVDPKVQQDLEKLGVNVKDNEGNFVGLESVLNQLGGALGSMGGPTSAMAMSLKDMGVSAFDSSGKFVGMDKVLSDLTEEVWKDGTANQDLIKKLKGLGFEMDNNSGAVTLSEKKMKELEGTLTSTGGNVDKMSKLQKIFGTEGLRAAMALVDEKDKLKGLSSEMNDATFKENAYNTVVESTGSKLEIVNNKMEAARIVMGESMAPATGMLADAMSGLASVLMILPDPLQGVAGMAIFAAQGLLAVGPLLMGLGALRGLNLAGTLGDIALSLKGVGSSGLIAMAGLGPLLPVLIGLGIGLAAVYALYKLGVLDFFYDLGAACGPGVADAIDQMVTNISYVPEIISTVIGNVISYFVNLPGNIAGALGSIAGLISGPFEAEGEILRTVFSSIPGMLLGAFSDITTAFGALGASVQGAFTNLFTGIGDFIVGLGQGFISAGYNIIMFIVQGMQSAAGAVGSAIGGIFDIIGKFIPHSPAQEGPLSVLPNFSAYFVDPLLAVAPAVQAASLQVAAAVTIPVAQPASMTGGGTSIGTQDNSAPISIGNVNASKDYDIQAIMADIAAMQAQKRAQRGIPSG